MVEYRLSNADLNSTGGYVPTTTTVSNNLGYTWTYPYGYATEAQVAELRGKVEVLEMMVAALLDGRPAAKRRRAK